MSKEIVGKATDIATSITKLLIAIVVKNILLPITFLWIAVKCSLPIVRYSRRLISAFQRDSKDLGTAALREPESM